MVDQKIDYKRLDYLKKVRSIVIKLGTRLILSDNETNIIEKIAKDVSFYREKGYRIVIVSSGAVGHAIKRLGLKSRPKNIKKIQALAAIGQPILMDIWRDRFSKYNKIVSQLLLTYDSFEDRKKFLHVKDCFQALFDMDKVIPIVNENDTVAIEELKFGDNDTLAAHTSVITESDLLIILSDIDGVYNKNPHKYEDAQFIDFVEDVSKIEVEVDDIKDGFSLGGMSSKLKAAKMATDSGVSVIITDGCSFNLERILKGERIGTFFKPKKLELSLKKKWLLYNRRLKGKIYIDRGAENALVKSKKSLLPSGIIKVEGDFNEGEVVGVYSQDNILIAKGITYYSSSEIREIMGKSTDEIKLLDKKYEFPEVVDRDNMIVGKFEK